MFKETITPEEIETYELISFPGKIWVIDSEGADCDFAAEHLSKQRIIGFDTETRPVFTPNTPRHKTALLQLSSETDAFLFRLNKMGLPREIADIMADRSITKVGAAVQDDIYGLYKHREFRAARFMDLQNLGFEYGIREKSVRKMAAIIFGRKVSKAQQCSNWEDDELSEAQQLYAATDAWICLKMYKVLLGSPKVKLKPLIPPQQ
ncbi:MAG: 3'-5' exonuclease domain-containing protein 2 [Bacteroidales bacterium]|nr:3'-5' exonuclease domain-containing protein 2 [Bacteroidales bacterium]